MNTSFSIRACALFVLCIAWLMIGACQKGDGSVNPSTAITRLVVNNFNPNTWDLLYNGQPANIFGTYQFKILAGPARFTLVNKETGKTDFEGEFDIAPADDTLFLFQVNQQTVTMLRNTQASEPPKEGYIKVKLAYLNTKKLVDGPVNVVFRHVIGINWDTSENLYSEKTDTIFNVTAQFGDTYKEIPLNIDEIISGVNPAAFKITFLDQHNQPVLKDGKPFITDLDPGLYWEIDEKGPYVGTSICTSYISDEDTWDAGSHWQMYVVNLFAN